MKISVYSSVKHTCAHQITVLPMYLHRKTGYSHNADIYIYKHVRVGGAIFFSSRLNMLALCVLSTVAAAPMAAEKQREGACLFSRT